MNITDVGTHDRRRHRHRPRQDGARRGRRGPRRRRRSPRSTRRRSSRTPTCSTSSAPTSYPRATEHIPEMIAHHRAADRAGARLRRGRHRLLRRHHVPRLRQAVRQHARQLRGRPPQELGVDPNKRHPEDFALWKPAGPAPRAEVAVPVGRGLPRLAHRVLGDVDEVPRRALRHPHRRQRQQVPAPRGRDRAVRGRHRPPGRLDLGARRVPADGRPEDGQVRQERLPGDRPGRGRHRPSRLPAADVREPVPRARWTSAGRLSRARTPGCRRFDSGMVDWAGQAGVRGPPGDAERPTRSTGGSGRRWPTISTCRRRWSS